MHKDGYADLADEADLREFGWNGERLPMTTALPTPGTPTGSRVGLLSDSSFTQLVNDALRTCQSTLALSRSALAGSPLVTPTLVKDEASPTAEERGHGLRLVLQWAVNLLAPAPSAYPIGTQRPFDDPTWRDPRWWQYNILRHRYLEPLHPDEFIEGGRFTESLLALTGISSSDAFFDERNRAVRTVAARLRQQLLDSRANGELQQLALQEAVSPLDKQPVAAKVLGIAAAFEDIFPHRLLMALAEQEGLTHADGALQALVQQRFLLTGDEGASLWLSPVLRGYIYARQAPADCQRRHRQIALAYERQGLTLPAARHWQRAEQDARAARILLPAVPALIHELQAKGLVDLLQQLEVKRLEDDQRFAIHLLLSDLFQRGGQHEEALGACRQALKATLDPTQQARVYRRMGKLYEGRNGLHALRYYQQAVERFAPGDPELAELYKDRGWLYFYRQEWTQAEQDLQQALHCTPEAEKGLQADIYDAMANLYRKRQQPDQALRYAERALAIREEVGDLLRVAKSLGNLGFLYRTMGEYSHAVAAHQEALETYGRLGNQELMAAAWLNIGAVQFLANQLEAALESYRQSLHICQSLELPLVELKAHYNLAEALAAAGRQAEALRHWQSGHRLCLQHSFDDQLADFLALGQTLGLVVDLPAKNGQHSPHPLAQLTLDADEDRVLKLARSEQILTPKRLMQAANISRATATRWLSGLVEKGWLTAQGKGRGAHYLLAEAPAAPTLQRIAVAEPPTNLVPSVLCQAQLELAQCHAVGALGLAPMEPNSRYLKIVVRFTSLPTLEHYLALKQALAAMVQMDVDLLPEIGPAPAVADRDIQWLW